jgi:hypothetical protein
VQFSVEKTSCTKPQRTQLPQLPQKSNPQVSQSRNEDQNVHQHGTKAVDEKLEEFI